MKKRLFSLMLACCLALTAGVSAADLEDDYEIFDVIGNDYTIRGPNGWGGSVLSSHSGVKDKAGNVVIPADYIYLAFLGHSNALIARKHVGASGYADGIIDINQNVLVPFRYTLIQKMWKGKDPKYLTIEDSNTFLRGLMGPDFSVVVPMKYAGVEVLSEEDGYFLVASPDGKTMNPSVLGWNVYHELAGKFGVCDKNGTLIIPCVYDQIGYLGDGYFSVRQNEVVGVVDHQNNMILPMEYARNKNPLYNGISLHKNIFIVQKYRSDEYRQRAAAGEGAPDIGEFWTTAGVVDANNNVLIDFGKYQAIRFTEGTFTCARWTGGYKENPVQVIGGSTAYTNEYEYDYIPYDSLKVTAPSKPAPSAAAVGRFTDVKPGSPFADAVQWAVGRNITSGTGATTFSPGSKCTRAQILTFLWRAAGSPEPAGQESPYADVVSGSINPDFYKAILWAAEQGIAGAAEKLAPNAPCTRAAAVGFLWRYAGSPEAETGKAFTDVAEDADCAAAVAWAVKDGVTAGTGDGTTFSPDAACTRGQIVTFLHRAIGD